MNTRLASEAVEDGYRVNDPAVVFAPATSNDDATCIVDATVEGVPDFLSHAKHGDYLAEDNSTGAYIHSAMFLAYDNNTGECWTLDGNAAGVSEEGRNRLGGHEVWVRQQNCDVIAGWGEIITDML